VGSAQATDSASSVGKGVQSGEVQRDEWTNLAKAEGVRYMVITSKQHDGFSMFRSKASDFDMELTAYRGDPLKDMATAVRRKDLRLGFYHSIMDWHHPSYRPLRAWEHPKDYKEDGDLNAYVDFLKGQLEELLTNYGDVAMIWFDGEWEHSTAEMRNGSQGIGPTLKRPSSLCPRPGCWIPVESRSCGNRA